MRTIPALMVDALEGSVPDAKIIFHAFYDGVLSSDDPLPVGDWSLSWSCRDQVMVRSSGSFVAGDDSATLAPWGLDEPLSAAGSQITAVFHAGGEAVDLARMTVTANTPRETFNHAAGRWNLSASRVGVDFDELSRLIQDDEFISTESPPPGATVISELQRLLQGRVGVIVGPGIVDRALPAMVHPENRIEAVYTLVNMVGDARFTGDGQLYVYAPDSTPKFTIRGKPMGNLVDLARAQSRDSFYNVVVSTGKDDDGNELKAYSTVTAGPLRDGGPFGRRIHRHTAVASTQAGVQADADTTLARLLRDSTVEIDIEAIPDPSIEAGDYGTVMVPAADGNEYALTGRCLDLSLSGGAGGFNPMKLTLACPAVQVQRIGDLLADVRRNP